MTSSINPQAAILQLKERSDKLDQKHFDWVAWKRGTLLVLQNIFGTDSPYYQQLAETDYEYSSWSLRDTSGSSDPVKSSCLDLLDICRTDLLSHQEGSISTKEKMAKLLSQYLTASQISKMMEVVKSDIPPHQKNEQIGEILKEFSPELSTKVLIELIREFS
ncbi:hypothetical protein [Geofilum rubicundum]|uniref:Uncharacterized protein n=1 Tax=Geofilum rubicundum JCM 15548 TaxID=1236989 RepID=A0A0E9LZL5_9BACT|nr:hypothetical protein [Geofilum rubicundum]GAO30566.1 hypothetical protein JCM15548_12852 [Geofilum rubicundum JCM 15548]